MRKVYKIVVAEDHQMVRDFIKKHLELDPEIEVVACVSNGKLAVEACITNDIDVVLMDLVMPEQDGIKSTQMIMNLNKNIKVLILTSLSDSSMLIEAARAGASGYLSKDSSADDMIMSIKNTINGKMVFEKGIFDGVLDDLMESKKTDSAADIFSDLNENEFAVLSVLAKEGVDNKDIAKKTYLSEGTVRGIISRLMKKYGLNKRTQLALFALKNGLG